MNIETCPVLSCNEKYVAHHRNEHFKEFHPVFYQHYLDVRYILERIHADKVNMTTKEFSEFIKSREPKISGGFIHGNCKKD